MKILDLKRKTLQQKSQSTEELDENELLMETEEEFDGESYTLKRAKQDKIIHKVREQIEYKELSLTILPESSIWWFNIGSILQVKSFIEGSSLTQELLSYLPSKLNINDIYQKLINKPPKRFN